MPKKYKVLEQPYTLLNPERTKKKINSKEQIIERSTVNTIKFMVNIIQRYDKLVSNILVTLINVNILMFLLK